MNNENKKRRKRREEFSEEDMVFRSKSIKKTHKRSKRHNEKQSLKDISKGYIDPDDFLDFVESY